MKGVSESFTAITNPSLLSYWKRKIKSQFINKNYVFLPLTCSNSGGLTPALCEEMIPQNRQNR